ncbi:nitroreductase family protein [Macrococcoides caseolyticum]|uniref:nitroreductase family protein n=1 Tax=Macrococcoides caseolyticum TaxID=69966 RepID=UPI001F1CB805|nr:nitroreductase family protein [Macrococcus caseolyticus]MCE4957649.1 nitroreductase family protein [Macrococcus caseolyticus]
MDSIHNKLLTRQAVKVYDPEYKMTEQDITDILEAANQAPSAWNLQHWKFLVVHSDAAKEKLLPLAFNQAQVKDASATIIILADKEANKNIDTVFDPEIKAGTMTEEIKQAIANQVNGAYQNEFYPIEAAIMNSAFPAMQVMNFATLKDLGTCALGGFNRTAVQEAFNIEERYIPALLITVGKALKTPRTSLRRPVASITQFI